MIIHNTVSSDPVFGNIGTTEACFTSLKGCDFSGIFGSGTFGTSTK